MDIRVLRYFLAVAREENISKAAEYLHITQPTLSRQLKELEDELNVSLFTRGKRNITLTDKGMLLRKRAEEITSLMDKTEAEFSNLDNLISGDVYIGGGETLAMKILAEVMTDMSEEYPDVRFHLYSGNADNASVTITTKEDVKVVPKYILKEVEKPIYIASSLSNKVIDKFCPLQKPIPPKWD